MSMVQLDLFEIAAQNERTQLSDSKPDPESLKVGDKVHVVWNNGVEFDGICTGLRGFWDGREEFKRWHWVQRYNTRIRGELHGTADYSHFDPYRNEWVYMGHDDGFLLPDKSTVVERLIERMKNVPFSKRLAVYQSFSGEYPSLSYAWHPIIRDAWETAIRTVTTLDEFIAAEKDWTCKLDLPKKAQEYIKTVAFSASPRERIRLIKQMRWIESKHGNRYYIEFLEQYDPTYYRKLYRKFIREARTPDELETVVRMRGGQRKWVDEKPPADFWIERSDTP